MERIKDSRSIETPYSAPAKEGRYNDARGAEKTPHKGAPDEVSRSRAERSLVTPYKGALGKVAPFKDARGKEKPFKSMPSKETPSEGIQEKEKARFWRGPDNLLHKGKRKHRGGKKAK